MNQISFYLKDHLISFPMIFNNGEVCVIICILFNTTKNPLSAYDLGQKILFVPWLGQANIRGNGCQRYHHLW